MKHYRSSIPSTAKERITATFVTGPQKYKAEYLLNRELVGVRFFHESGELQYEVPLKHGTTHGVVYRSDIPGKLTSSEPYFKGLVHGKAKQWSEEEKLIGTYTMRHGTGIDLWWNQHDGSTYLSEARHVQDGKWHGFEWWLNEDQKSVWQECHFWHGQLHGVERSWNSRGTLKRGYPKYWVKNARVSKRQYLRKCPMDPTLPPFQECDNRPERRFPREVLRALH